MALRVETQTGAIFCRKCSNVLCKNTLYTRFMLSIIPMSLSCTSYESGSTNKCLNTKAPCGSMPSYRLYLSNRKSFPMDLEQKTDSFAFEDVKQWMSLLKKTNSYNIAVLQCTLYTDRDIGMLQGCGQVGWRLNVSLGFK